MEKVLLLRQGELFLKGQNQGRFEKALLQNILLQTNLQGRKLRGRILLPFFTGHEIIKRVFGLTSYSPALRVGKTEEEITQAAVAMLAEFSGTFKIETNRADKQFPLTSIQLNMLIGKKIEEQGKLRYARQGPQHTLYLEINQEGAYLYRETFPCKGGLPVGVEGNVLLFLKDEASLLAGILMMKRGCAVIPVSSAKQEVNSFLPVLQKYSPLCLSINQISSEEDLSELAKREKALALVSGDSLNSPNLGMVSVLPLLKPLIAFSPEEIERRLENYS